ncbi:molybdopterin-dependent oxidoreductase [Streptomyces litchfieldiae]|uniref:Molybdopterin-dependent oxidoreductase n=1 Tax=Streptomyces litchfieldiae TaxID=3075543 RepID=A0ABU2MWW1_9ACTN|nr:molybdopterin-dependent oxidoreductase [Streptomyces sp. DSM 44938]MDT0345961.1 molybdopterin-dependent oxidoreductase [Streptomyces sp. DSM 44938]
MSGRSGQRALGALGGLVAGAAGLAAGELASAAVRREASPVTAVGDAAIELAPVGLTDWAIDVFGTNDKLALEIGIVAVLGLCAAVLGALAPRFRLIGPAGAALFGLVGVAAAVTRPDAGGGDAWPSVLAAVAAGAVLWVLAGRLAESPDGAAGDGDGFDRRGFLTALGAAAAASAGAGLWGRALHSADSAEAAASRAALTIPAPDVPAAPVPPAAELDVPGLGPFLTPNRLFYRIDTALRVPRVDATRWRLRVSGRGVPRPVTMTLDQLLRRELVERDITLTCVSNPVGGTLIGNARWIGVQLADVLREAGVRPPSEGGPADQLVARSVDGMTLGSPLETVMDGRDALLAVGMNGEPLPFEHGFPVRMVVPGLYGYVSACKWLQGLELTTFDDFDAYWVDRGWAEQGPIKTQSRIDTPRPSSPPVAGRVPVAGVAWAQHTGIERVEVRVDDGPWQEAELAAEDTADTWRQWRWDWTAEPGEHRLQVRATDRAGRTQTETTTGTAPDGATGWHTVTLEVREG